MATSIDPFAARKKTQPLPQPVDPAAHRELLARVSGVTPPPAPPTPEVPGPPPGVPGNVPLPAGRIVTAADHLTAVERAAMRTVGWTDDVPLPATDEGRKQLQAIVAAARADVPPDLDLTRPPLKVETVNIDSLPPAKQHDILAKLAEITQAEVTNAGQARQQQDRLQQEAAVKGIGGATGAATQAINAFKAAQAAAQPPALPLEEEVYRVPPPKPQAPSPAQPPAAQAPAPGGAKPPSETGAAYATLTHCPHCAWDLSLPDGVEPEYPAKLAFLHCMLGEKVFTKDYPLFAGAVVLTLRTLTTRELDTVYLQVHADLRAGKIQTQDDVYESINRYKLMLQIQEIRSDSLSAFRKDLPDGYSKTKNPNATAFWVTPEQEAGFTADETGLPVIAEYVLENVLKTETIFRVMSGAYHRFNRLVSRLEAMADNSDFWKPTGGPS